MRQASFKKGLGTVEDATRRRAEMKKTTTKEQRDEKIQKRRAVGGSTNDSLPALISSLTTNIESLPILDRILRHPESDFYYEPSPIYPEIKGPFLFPTEKPLQWLISLLDPNVPIDSLRMVVGCFQNISAHHMQGLYVPRLIRLGLVEKLIHLCPLVKDDTLYEYTLEILSNMCLDNAESRDYVVSSKIMQIVPHVLHSWPCINASASFMRAIFRSGRDLPAAKPLTEFWQKMTHSVLFEHFPDGESVEAGKAANGFSALINILRCIHLLVRESDSYKVALTGDTALMNQLTIYSRKGIHSALLIIVELTYDLSLHSLLVPFIPVFVHSMNTRDPSLIICGSHGLANLAESVESFPMIVHDQVLSSIRMQFEYNEVSIAQDLLRQAIAWIIITAPDRDTVYPKMLTFICRLSDAIVLPGSVNVIMRSLEALEHLIKWNKDLICPICEECDVMSRLNRLQHYGNDAMQERVIQLLDWIERGTEYMEDE